MRIIVSGTSNTGKTTLINDFLKQWPNYRKSDFDYRKLIADATTHSKNTTVELQTKIMNGMIDEISTWGKDDNVIMDRGPLDCLMYSIWCNAQDKDGFDENYIEMAAQANALVSNMIDLIIFVPLTTAHIIPIVDTGKREVDSIYIREIDNLFKMVIREVHSEGKSPFFYPRRIPGIIEVFGEREERIEILSEYLTKSGNLEDPIIKGLSEGETLLQQFEQGENMAQAKREKAAQQEAFFKDLASKYNNRK